MGFVRPATRLTFASDLFLVNSFSIWHRFCATSNKADLCKLNHLITLVSVYDMGFERPAKRLQNFASDPFFVNYHSFTGGIYAA